MHYREVLGDGGGEERSYGLSQASTGEAGVTGGRGAVLLEILTIEEVLAPLSVDDVTLK